MSELTPAPVLLCANCHAPLEGKYCHHCGQSVKSVLRPMHSMVEDTLDMVFHVDERIVHTVPPLFLKPGFLSLEYFAGRRVRYVAPFRLMFVFCLLALFAVHLSMGSLIKPDHVGPVDTGDFAKDQTVAAVDARLKKANDSIEEGEKVAVPGLAAGMNQVKRATERAAAIRRAQIDPTLPAVPDVPNTHHATSNLSHARVIGPFADMEWTRRVERNLSTLGNGDAEGVDRFVSGVFSVLPQTMFVLLPVFALLLKLVYLFRRRLYMEHMIVALHSHAFLFLAVLLLALLAMLKSLVASHAAWAGTATEYVSGAIWIWMPIYLLLVQKRVYRQGWAMTILKYLVTGFFYTFLLTFALLAAAAIALSH
jgi:hypothetical protein